MTEKMSNPGKLAFGHCIKGNAGYPHTKFQVVVLIKNKKISRRENRI
jgi:hypothetical protein